MNITFITVSAPAVKSLIECSNQINREYGNILNLKIYYALRDMENTKLNEMVESIAQSDLTFVDLMGSPEKIIESVYKGLEFTKGNVIPYGSSCREYLKLGEFQAGTSKDKSMTMADMKKSMSMSKDNMNGHMAKGNMSAMRKMQDMKNYGTIMEYFKIANVENIKNMLCLILKEYGKHKEICSVEEPKRRNSIEIYDPSNMVSFPNVEEYAKCNGFDETKPVVAMLFYAHTYPNDTSSCVNAVKNKLEEYCNVIPIGFVGNFEENRSNLETFLIEQLPKPLDLIINFMAFRLGAGPMGGDFKSGIEFLKKVNVPYMHPFFLNRRTRDQWEESVQGCGTSEVMISVMLPELDGTIDTYPIAAKTSPRYNKDFDVYIEELEIIPERVERLVSRVRAQLRLRTLENSEKKVAIICYNYPPGEGNLFGGAFLDTFESVENILRELKEHGYNTEDLSKDELMSVFLDKGMVNTPRYSFNHEEFIKYPSSKYSEEIKNYKDYEELIKEWGKAPGKTMTVNGEFMIPGTIQGNVFIGLQPSKGVHEDSDKLYHDKTIPPHHQYQGFYKWIREEFKADAIVHVGTHGTLEFLKGKECGMSGDCYEDKLISHLPHTYLYYCGNPSEGIIAKRRSYANLVGYQPPVFVPGELYGEYSKLLTLVDNYNQAVAINTSSSKDILKEILGKAKELNLSEDIEEIEMELYRMNSSLIPKGLHIFGRGYSKDQCKEYVRGLLQYTRNDVVSLRELISRARGLSIEELIIEKKTNDLREIEKEADEIFYRYVEKNELKESIYVNKSNRHEFIKTLEYGKQIIKESSENHEIRGLLKTLSGEYNEAKLAGDIYRNSEVLPTGYNLYQFDPRLIPTKSAYERGKRICINTLEAYKEETSEYPNSTAVILWGLETSRTQGETLCQILYYLGVRLLEGRDQWNCKYEIIPIEELGRPRIDVTINICGFFRDMFPNLIEQLQDIFLKIYKLQEDYSENYFKANSHKIYEKLIEEGYSHEAAEELAISRIFGPREGEYGTSLTDIIETKSWQNEEEIGSVFLSSLKHVYNKSSRGKVVKGLYESNLKSVDVVSQTRSNHEYEITDLDHYYEFFGGLAKSVEMVKGKKAKMYITDTTGEAVLTESVEKSINRGIRTRLLNPKWVEGVLEHGYHGVQEIAKRFENIMGLAATTNSVEEWIYDELQRCYIEDEDLKERLMESNPYAYIDILERMLEYHKRGYWKATKEQIRKIKENYLKVEGNIEEEN